MSPTLTHFENCSPFTTCLPSSANHWALSVMEWRIIQFPMISSFFTQGMFKNIYGISIFISIKYFQICLWIMLIMIKFNIFSWIFSCVSRIYIDQTNQIEWIQTSWEEPSSPALVTGTSGVQWKVPGPFWNINQLLTK